MRLDVLEEFAAVQALGEEWLGDLGLSVYRQRDLELRRLQNRQYYRVNRRRLLEYGSAYKRARYAVDAEYRKRCLDENRARRQQLESTPEGLARRRAYQRAYERKEFRLAYQRAYRRVRYHTDPEYRRRQLERRARARNGVHSPAK